MLHITNGDSAVERIRRLDLGGEILPWRDVLHEGPVPAPATLDSLRPLRARFLADPPVTTPVDVARELEQRDRRLGATAADDEVALWFEHDLYDQLQLVQVLDWFASTAADKRPRRLTLAQSNDYLGCLDAARLMSLWELRHDVTRSELEVAQRAWRAFSAPDPLAIEEGLDDLDALPYLRPALARHLEEFPAVGNGLSRTERQALEVLVDGDRPFSELFPAAHHARETPVFLGDATFLMLLRGLAAGDRALVRFDGSVVSITPAGRDVLGGRCDRVETLGIDRWLGGVHLRGHDATWRWDPAAGKIVVRHQTRHK